MAAPNIAATTSIIGKTTFFAPTGTTTVVLLPNAASSNKVFRINQIIATNVGAATAAASVALYTNGSVAQGSAPSGGTSYPLANAMPLPVNASIYIIEKSTAIYLEEGRSVTVTSGTANAINFTVSYEEIS